MSNWPNADVQFTSNFSRDFKASDKKFAKAVKDGKVKKPTIKKVPLSKIVDPIMARGMEKNRVGWAGQFVFPSKTLVRAGAGNTQIDRQLFVIPPARPYGNIPSGSRGATAFPPR